MDQDNTYLGIIQEMNINSGVYMRASSGFCMVETDAPTRHHGGVTLFYKYLRRFMVEVLQLNIPNVVRFQMAIGGQCWNILG